MEPRNGKIALVALGSNATSSAGGSRETVQAALDRLRESWPDIMVSGLYRTPCFPAGAGPDFVNAACAFACDLDADALLEQLHALEAAFGRERVQRWGQRTLDLDLIALGGSVVPDRATHDIWRELPLEEQARTAPPQLILPHPRVQDRPFVLVPLADIAPDWHHPVLGLSVRRMLAKHSADAIAAIEPL